MNGYATTRCGRVATARYGYARDLRPLRPATAGSLRPLVQLRPTTAGSLRLLCPATPGSTTRYGRIAAPATTRCGRVATPAAPRYGRIATPAAPCYVPISVPRVRTRFAQLITPLDIDGIGQNWEDSDSVVQCPDDTRHALGFIFSRKIDKTHYLGTAVLAKTSHANCRTTLTNRPSRGRRGRFVRVVQQSACEVFQRTAV